MSENEKQNLNEKETTEIIKQAREVFFSSWIFEHIEEYTSEKGNRIDIIFDHLPPNQQQRIIADAEAEAAENPGRIRYIAARLLAFDDLHYMTDTGTAEEFAGRVTMGDLLACFEGSSLPDNVLKEWDNLTPEDKLKELWHMEIRSFVNLWAALNPEAIPTEDAITEFAQGPARSTVTRAQSVEFPLDKPNSYIWNLLESDTTGQIEFNLAKSGSKKNIPAYYAINFDELGDDITITKRLLPFDKRVYIAVSALFNAGNNVITLTQIYYAMGYTGKPGPKDRQKINESITKMTAARIFFDNEAEASKYKYRRFKYDGSLLPIERAAAIVNGKESETAIHIFREPPLISFAKQRQQITTIDVKLLQSPGSKTDINLSIEDYLLERISKKKRGKQKSCRILYATLYDRVRIPNRPRTNTERQQKKRAPGKIEKYLTYYQQQGFISKFTTDADGVTVYWA